MYSKGRALTLELASKVAKLKQQTADAALKAPPVSESSATLACDYGESQVIMMQALRTPDGITVEKFHRAVKMGEKKPADLLKQAFDEGHFSTNKVRVSVKGQGVICRFIQFPQMKLDDLKSAISYEAEKYIPFKASEVVMDFYLLDENVTHGGGSVMNLLLVAVKRDDVYPMVQSFQDVGLQIEVVDIDALASINALEYFHPETIKTSVAILDIGAEMSTLSVVRHGKPRFIRDISFGGVDIVKRLKRKLGLSEAEAREKLAIQNDKVSPEIKSILHDVLGNLVADLKVSIDYYMDQVSQSEPIQMLYIGGGEASLPIYTETLERDLRIPMHTMEFMTRIKLGPDVEAAKVRAAECYLPIVLGLCLRDK